MKAPWSLVFSVLTIFLLLGSCGTERLNNLEMIKETTYQLGPSEFSENRLAVNNGKSGEDRRWGYIDASGALVIPFQFIWYDSFTEDGILRTASEKNSFRYVDLNGNPILTNVQNMDINFADIFIDGYAVVNLVGKTGQYVINLDGDIILTPEDQQYGYRNIGHGLFCRTSSDPNVVDAMVVDSTGAQPFDIKLADIWSLGERLGFYSLDRIEFGIWDSVACEKKTEPRFTYVSPYSDGVALVVTIQNDVEMIDEDGNCIINLSEKYPDMHTEALRFVSHGFVSLTIQDGNTIILNSRGELVANTSYDDIDIVDENIAICRKDGKYGYIDVNGNELVPPIYDQASTIDNGVGFLSLDGTIYRYVVEDKG